MPIMRLNYHLQIHRYSQSIADNAIYQHMGRFRALCVDAVLVHFWRKFCWKFL